MQHNQPKPNRIETDRPDKLSRRGALAWAGLGAVGSQGVSGWGIWAWEKWSKRAIDVDLLEIFPSFASTQLSKGEHHPKRKFHPDVRVALDEMTSILMNCRSPSELPVEALPEVNRDGNIVLLGGPISNELTRELHGHTISTEEKVSEFPNNRRGFRWHFGYPERSHDDPTFGRYVDGAFTQTWPKFIVDTKASAESTRRLGSGLDPQTGLITSDYLLITVQPNTLGSHATGNTIIEISDLQGQGDKAFPRLLQNKDAMRDLANEVKGMRYFQALYSVPVEHNIGSNSTEPGLPKRIGVFSLL